MIWRLPHPLPPSTVSIALPATHRKTEKERQFADGRGGLEPNRTMARKPGPLQILQYSLVATKALVVKKMRARQGRAVDIFHIDTFVMNKTS
jgi:hypothetical protein